MVGKTMWDWIGLLFEQSPLLGAFVAGLILAWWQLSKIHKADRERQSESHKEAVKTLNEQIASIEQRQRNELRRVHNLYNKQIDSLNKQLGREGSDD